MRLLTQKRRERELTDCFRCRRYSKEHKYRPAASPIITETLKDGRLRVRGAGPTTSATPTPTPVKPKSTKKRTKKRAGKAKKGKGKGSKA